MKIGSVGGIGVYIHWTFWLLIAVYLVSATTQAGLAAGLTAVLFVLSIFGCVLLHEFGHAGAAAVFGIPTHDITLLPFGGVARLARMPSKPYQELIIALAGPAVNVVIAIGLFFLLAIGVVIDDRVPLLAGADLISQLLVVNIVLVLFNLLPAFPMDGGRVLRSLIAMRTNHLRATEIAARIGRWMAIGFGVYGIVQFNFGLLLVAGFVYFAGTMELLAARAQAAQVQAPPSSWGTYRATWPPQGQASQASQTAWSAYATRGPAAVDPFTTPHAERPQPRPPAGVDVVDAVQVRHLN